MQTDPHKPRALIIRTAGTNCDAEMVRAFELAGAAPELVHVDALIAAPERIAQHDLIGLPGGFSYGDDVASGRVMAMRMRLHLYEALRDAARRRTPMIGVCNGFQTLVQLGLLPGPPADEGGAPDWPDAAPPAQTVVLTDNAGGRFIDDWARVEAPPSRCVWTRPLAEATLSVRERDDIMRLPLASGEGRFVPASDDVLTRLEADGQVALRYVDNLNGSVGAVAGICDASGLIFGLMPHPDRYLDWTLHPYWTRLPASERRGDPPGLRIFRAAVDHIGSRRAVVAGR